MSRRLSVTLLVRGWSPQVAACRIDVGDNELESPADRLEDQLDLLGGVSGLDLAR